MIPTVVLASASPARLATLRAAGLDPQVVVSGVAEQRLEGESPAATAQRLAIEKASAVVARLTSRPTGHSAPPGATTAPRVDGLGDPDFVVVGADSVLDLDGIPLGKPGSVQAARLRWLEMRGRTGVLHTGHAVVLLSASSPPRWAQAVASTTVQFADLSDEEIDAYVATGEPLQVAGAFTIDGLGGAFVERVDGDPHNVVGVSLPLLRQLVRGLGIPWPSLWAGRSGGPALPAPQRSDATGT